MRKLHAVLFGNKVFSLAPNTYGNKSYLEEDMFQKKGDTYFAEISLFEGNLNNIYSYDSVETFFREERIKKIKNKNLDLSFAKKVIVDEHYPAFQEFWVVDGDGLNEDWEMTVSINDFYLPGGRSCLVDLIKHCRYSEAIPELREIALHDDSMNMRRRAIFALGTLDRQKADEVVNEVLGLATDRWLIMDIILYMNQYSLHDIFIQNLHKKFEEYYHDFVDDWLAIKYFHTVPQSIVLVCSRILSIEALEIIEKGIRHPYPHVERNAKYAMYNWLERISKSEKVNQSLLKKAVEIQKKYDTRSFEGEAWKCLKKLPQTGLY